MDLIGEIVEHDTTKDTLRPVEGSSGGFPDKSKYQEKRRSKWRSKRTNRREPKLNENDNNKNAFDEHITEGERIHQENLKKMAQMTEEEIIEEREELLRKLDPKVVEAMLNRINSREKEHHENNGRHEHAEGYNGWIGGGKDGECSNNVSMLDNEEIEHATHFEREDKDNEAPTHLNKKKHEKKVRYDDHVALIPETIQDIAAENDEWEEVIETNGLKCGDSSAMEEKGEESDMIQGDSTEISSVHFVKPKNKDINDGLDLDDPNFYDKLHEKYFPDLPKETKKLSWMTNAVPTAIKPSYDSLSDMRFDFNGDLVKLDENMTENVPTYMGLHHHSLDPNLPGYTLAELAHLSRSTVPSQRSISIRTLGRILHKLGLQNYDILPITDDDTESFSQNIEQLQLQFHSMTWDLIEELRIIESIQGAADEKQTKNLSIRNYAIEALWLWKQGGGRKKTDDEAFIVSHFSNN